MKMEILAITGSVRDKSYNTALLQSAVQLAPAAMHVSIYQRIDTLPIFNPDLNATSVPAAVGQFRERLSQADGIMISTPEYAHGVPGGLKNALDWVVDSGELVLKPVLVSSVSTSGLGGMRSHSALVMILTAMNANVVIDAGLQLPYAKNRFNAERGLSDEITIQAMKLSLLALERAVSESQ